MYVPLHFSTSDLGELRQLMVQYPLGSLVTLGNDGLTRTICRSSLMWGEETGVYCKLT